MQNFNQGKINTGKRTRFQKQPIQLENHKSSASENGRQVDESCKVKLIHDEEFKVVNSALNRSINPYVDISSIDIMTSDESEAEFMDGLGVISGEDDSVNRVEKSGIVEIFEVESGD